MKLVGRGKIRKLDRHLKPIAGGSQVICAVGDLQDRRDTLREIGFSSSLGEGETVLPTSSGPTSHYNAEGREIIQKDKPMETAYWQQEWTWEEWHGRTTTTRSRIVDVPYKRYPRKFVEPPSVELTIAKDVSGDKVVICDAVEYVDAQHDQLLHRINLFRELFGECDLLTGDLSPYVGVKVRRLNWEVLPAGELPWKQVRERLGPILDSLGERKGPAVEARLKLLTQDHAPDFGAFGRAGFQGYLVFGYNEKRLYVLESLQYGNATYVFGEDWERLSQLSKAEILAGGLHKERVVHLEGWAATMRQILR